MTKRGYLFIVSCLMIILIFISTEVYATTIQKKFRGSDRYAKSVNICENKFNKLNYAVLVSGEGFADALWVAPLAKKFNAPIILTNGKVLDSDVKNELIRLNVKKVFIVATTGVISGDMERQIYSANIDYQRISRMDRYETSLKVAQFIVSNNGMMGASEKKIPDALSIAQTANAKGMSVSLVDKRGLSNDVTKNMDNSKSLSGADRYETNIKTVNKFSNSIEFRSIYVTIGKGFEDAVSASASAAKINSPIVFTDCHVLLLKTAFGSKVSSISDLTTLGEEEGMPEVTAQTLLSDKNIIEDKSYDAEKIRKIIENNFESDGRKIAFLTFDDGPSTTVTPKILDILKNNDIKATFFLIGSSIQSDEESKSLVMRILKDGHTIGNHTYTHNLKIIYPGNKVDSQKYMEEVKETNDAISNAIGQEFKTRIIRMPGGYMSRKYYNDPNLNAFNSMLKENNMYSIDWNAYDGDADGRRKSAEELLREVKNTVGNKEKVVLLMHDTYGKEETAKALPKIIEYLKNQGYEFRTIK